MHWSDRTRLEMSGLNSMPGVVKKHQQLTLNMHHLLIHICH